MSITNNNNNSSNNNSNNINSSNKEIKANPSKSDIDYYKK